MTSIAKVTAKGQTTIPREIRSKLKAKPGDFLAWEITADGRIEVRRIQQADMEYLRAVEKTLGEWETPEDEKAYHDL